MRYLTERRLAAAAPLLVILTVALYGFAALLLNRSSGNERASGDTSAVRYRGDFESGDFSQWISCQNRLINEPCRNYAGDDYALRLSNEARQGDRAARFELRDGDVPEFGGGERTEVRGSYESGGYAGDERWYQWSTRFDETFQDDFASQGWGLVAQWHDDGNGSPPLGFYTDVADGRWGLRVNRQSAPGEFESNDAIWSAPLNKGEWQDIKLRVKWSTDPSVGFIELWHNGNRVTFEDGGCAGQERCVTQTMTPGGGDRVYFKQGIYRSRDVSGASVVFHDGFVAADRQAGLGAPDRR